ncbi:MAG: radical SAM protein [Dissulfurispiraceae bacterium]
MDKYLIDGHKLFWHLDRVVEWQDNRVIPPVYIEISPVSFCNHRCIFCGIDFARDKGFQLDTGLLCKRLEEMGRLGVRSIMFAGEGEPLLHKDLPKLIKVAKDSGMDVSLTTNGTIGNYEIWTEVLPYLTWIRFSVDAGSPEVHSKVHNVPADFFNRTIGSIKEALRVKRDLGLEVTIGVQFLIIEENIKDIENALRLFDEIGVDYLSLKPYSLHPQMIKKRDTAYTDELIDGVEAVISEYGANSKLNVIFRKEAFSRYVEKNKMFGHCRALPFWGYISSKGDFYTCSVFIGDERFRTGNIYANGMAEILSGEKRQASIRYGEEVLIIEEECRLNCRMSRINEFLEFLDNKPEHINFI